MRQQKNGYDRGVFVVDENSKVRPDIAAKRLLKIDRA
ncbi:hypothetical protein SAMN05192541_14142 [Bradyrhizobium arachidis]|nr:hypothetical protein SAMN05192541_14142 [Bradyrhizobium arachidis]